MITYEIILHRNFVTLRSC